MGSNNDHLKENVEEDTWMFRDWDSQKSNGLDHHPPMTQFKDARSKLENQLTNFDFGRATFIRDDHGRRVLHKMPSIQKQNERCPEQQERNAESRSEPEEPTSRMNNDDKKSQDSGDHNSQSVPGLSQFKEALSRLRNQLQDSSFSEPSIEKNDCGNRELVSRANLTPGSKKEDEESEKTYEEFLEWKRMQKQIVDGAQQQTKKEEISESRSEPDTSEALEKLRSLLSRVEELKERVHKLEGTRDGMYYRHLQVSLLICQSELDDIDTLGVERVRNERKNAFKKITEILDDLDKRADSNVNLNAESNLL